MLTDLDVNDQVSVFKDKIMNIRSSFVPNEITICYDREPPLIKHHTKKTILLYVEKTGSSLFLYTSSKISQHQSTLVNMSPT